MKKSNVIFTIVIFAIVLSVIVFKLTGRMEILKNRYNPVEDTECSEHVESTEPSEDETNSEPTVNAVESKEKPVNSKNTNELKSTYPQEDTYPYEDTTESSYVETEPKYYELTYDEIDMLARLVYLEAGGESYECMKGVASVVLNRMTSTGMSLHDVIYEPYQFSPACYIESTCYTDTVYSVRCRTSYRELFPAFHLSYRPPQHHIRDPPLPLRYFLYRRQGQGEYSLLWS